MKAKEKANELVNKYDIYLDSVESSSQYEWAKQCAFIAVEYIIEYGSDTSFYIYNTYFWQDVKTELEKL